MRNNEYDTFNSFIESVSCTRDSSMIWMKKDDNLGEFVPPQVPLNPGTQNSSIFLACCLMRVAVKNPSSIPELGTRIVFVYVNSSIRMVKTQHINVSCFER